MTKVQNFRRITGKTLALIMLLSIYEWWLISVGHFFMIHTNTEKNAIRFIVFRD